MDHVSPERRSEIMRAVKSRGTSLERRFFQLMREAGMTGFETHPEGMTGNPDAVFKEAKIALFIDSCFWHGCPKHLRRPSSNQEYWNAKIDRNVRRDRRNRAALRRKGWSVLRVWEHDMRKPTAALNRIRRKLEERRGK